METLLAKSAQWQRPGREIRDPIQVAPDFKVGPELKGNIAKQVAPSMLDDVVSVLDNSWALYRHQEIGGGVTN